MPAATTYAPREISISVAGQAISGYAEDTFVVVSRTSDAFTMKAGADGLISRTHNADRSGSIVITLKQTSPSNDILSALHVADELTLNGKFPIRVADSNGTSEHVASDAWIMKVADAEYANDEGDREWTIMVADLASLVGSNS
jgi:hypothetical protein